MHYLFLKSTYKSRARLNFDDVLDIRKCAFSITVFQFTARFISLFFLYCISTDTKLSFNVPVCGRAYNF